MAALEFAPRISVNAVAPGLILPPAGRDLDYLERLSRSVPLQRFAARRTWFKLLSSCFRATSSQDRSSTSTVEHISTPGVHVSDRLFIRDLLVRCHVGLSDEELRERQDVLISLVLYLDLAQAAAAIASRTRSTTAT